MSTHELLVRYFDCNIIGSFLFVQKGLLRPDEVNDIDINVFHHQLQKVRQFLIDRGYSETEGPRNNPGYASVEGSLIFSEDGYHNIHLLPTSSLLDVYSISALIAAKYDRGTDSDFEQLSSVLNRKIGKLC